MPLNELASASARGQVVTRSTISVKDYLAEWLVTTKSKLRPSTHHSYAMSVDRIVAHLGRYQMRSLTPLQIERFYAEQLETGGRERRPLSPKTVRNTHVVLRKALADAERLELVPRNAAAAARPPAPERRDMNTWSSDDLGTFLAEIDDVRYSIGFRLLAATGMRRGEVLGLRWRDVDLDRARLAVAHTITTAGHEMVLGRRRRREVDATSISIAGPSLRCATTAGPNARNA
jgi:integrase